MISWPVRSGVPRSNVKQAPPLRTTAQRQKMLALREAQFRETAEHLAERLYGGEITVAQWQEAMKGEVKALLTSATIIGAGGDSRLVGFEEWGATGRRCRTEYGLLRNYGREIVTRAEKERLTLAYVKARSNLYSGAARHPFARAKAAQEGREHYRWKLNPAEHCKDCLRRAREWSRVALKEIRNWPGDLTTRCGCNCKCEWVPVD